MGRGAYGALKTFYFMIQSQKVMKIETVKESTSSSRFLVTLFKFKSMLLNEVLLYMSHFVVTKGTLSPLFPHCDSDNHLNLSNLSPLCQKISKKNKNFINIGFKSKFPFYFYFFHHYHSKLLQMFL